MWVASEVPDVRFMSIQQIQRTQWEEVKKAKGGISDPRNKELMKMLNMIGIGERTESGVPIQVSIDVSFRSGDVEAWGRGFLKIKAECKKSNKKDSNAV